MSMKFGVTITMAIFNIFAHLSNQYGQSILDLMVKLFSIVWSSAVQIAFAILFYFGYREIIIDHDNLLSHLINQTDSSYYTD